MLAILHWSSLSANEQKQQLRRATSKNMPKENVARIIANVKEQGDKALMQYSREFDGINLSALTISKKCIAQAQISETAFSAIKSAIKTITLFHKAVMPQTIQIDTANAEQVPALKRATIISQSLQTSKILLCSSRTEMITIVNSYSPEHLIINCIDAADWVDNITNAGTIFLGPYAAETMGDYVTGSNHVLPTNGYARIHSGLSTNDFLKAISVQSITQDGIKTLGKAAYTLAIMEGLDAHANAVKLRLPSLGESNECT